MLLLTQRKLLVESRKRIRREKKEAVRYNLLNTSERDLAKQNLFTFRFSTHEASIEIKRVSIDRSIGARTRLSTPRIAVNEGFTVDFRKIDSERAHCLLSSPSHPRSLSYTHARRNDETGRRLRESVFLAYYPFLRFPTVRKKNTRLGCWLMYRRYRPAALAVWLTRANRVNVHNSVSRFTAHYRFHSP